MIRLAVGMSTAVISVRPFRISRHNVTVRLLVAIRIAEAGSSIRIGVRSTIFCLIAVVNGIRRFVAVRPGFEFAGSDSRKQEGKSGEFHFFLCGVCFCEKNLSWRGY